MNFVRIEGYPDYVIHQCGTILKIWSHKTKKMKPWKTSLGYMRINLHKNGKQNHLLVHRLLALAFIFNDDPINKTQVDHIRGKHIGNSLNNLRWATAKENVNGFTSNPIKIITKGWIRKHGNSWQWCYRMSGVRKTKTMKSKQDLEKFREDKLQEYYL